MPAQPGLAGTLEAERERWFLWVPVFFGLGIGTYFALGVEPVLLVAVAVLAGGLALRLAVRRGTVAVALAGAVCWASLGFGAAKLRSDFVAAPVITTETDTLRLKGWLERIEPRADKRDRLTVRVASLEDHAPHETPRRVRVTSAFSVGLLETGSAIEILVRLFPPPEPVLPDGYDFARTAWFSALGGVGFTLSKPEPAVLPGAAPRMLALSASVERLRRAIGQRVLQSLPGEAGALANALIIGERGAIPEQTLENIRAAGLAHVLAISGLHMAMITGAVFGFARLVFAAVPAIALRYPTKSWAAVAALLCGAFYLVLSGGSIATQRAFVMIALMFLAVILGRPAISLRNLALAALAILAIRPESLLSASFQMSFAAVTGLVATFEAMRDRPDRPRLPRPAFAPARSVLLFLAGIILTTIIATVAVAPFTVFHFNKLAQYGLAANIVVVPLFTLAIMPLIVLSLLAMPFGLETAPLSALGGVLDFVAGFAARVSGWPEAVWHVPQITVHGLVLVTLGGLWLCLWRRRWRLAGIALMGAGVLAAAPGKRPDVLISRDAKTVAVRLEDGRLSSERGRQRTYALGRWLEADGDPRVPREAARSRGIRCDRRGCTARMGDWMVAMPKEISAVTEDCAMSHLVVMRFRQARPCPQARLVIDSRDIERKGAHVIWLEAGQAFVRTVGDARGQRPWTGARD